MSRSYLSTGAIVVAILSLGVEGVARVCLGVVALVLVAVMVVEERRDRVARD